MNQLLLSKLFLTILLCIGVNSFSQISEFYFTDTIGERQCKVTHTQRSDNAMYIAGTSYDHNWMQPSIIKLDFEGNKIWSTTDNDDFVVDNSVHHEVIDMILSDSYLCALVKLWHPEKAYYLWKVDLNTGEIVKKVTMTFNAIEPPVALTEYTDEFAILSYGYESYLPKAFAKLDLNSLSLSNKTSFENSGSYIYFDNDDQGNLYYSSSDTLYKVNANDFNEILWKHPVELFDELNALTGLYVHDDELIVLARGIDDFVYHKSGFAFYECESGTFSEYIEAGNSLNGVEKIFLRKDDFLYTVSTTLPFVEVTKLDLNNHQVVWAEKVGDYNYYNHCDAVSLDDQGDLYVGGSQNYDEDDVGYYTSWKVDGDSGEVLFVNHHTLRAEEGFDNKSYSRGIYYKDGKIFNIGALQDYTYEQDYFSTLFMGICDASNGEIDTTLIYPGQFRYPSSTHDIIQQEDGTVLYLKQLGGRCLLEKRAQNGELLWDAELRASYGYTLADALTVSTNGTLFVSAKINSTDMLVDEPTYFSEFRYFLLSQDGELLNEYSETEMTHSTEYYETIVTNDSIYMFHNDGDIIEYYLYDGTHINRNFTNVYNYQHLGRRNLLTQYEGTVLLACNKNGAALLKEIHPYKESYNEKGNLEDMEEVMCLTEVTDNEIVLGGANSNSKEMLIKYDLRGDSIMWSNYFLGGSGIHQIVYNEFTNHFYTAGTAGNSLHVRKINGEDGQQVWEYYYEAESEFDVFLYDMIFDPKRANILIAGANRKEIDDENITSQLFIEKVSDYGSFAHRILKTPYTEGVSKVLCLEQLDNGTILAGGQTITEEFGKCGFVYTVESLYSVSLPEYEVQNSIDIDCYPNPVTDNLNVKFNVNTEDEVFVVKLIDLNGKCLIHKIYKFANVGTILKQIDVSGLEGVYILEVSTGSTKMSEKIICLGSN